MRPTGTVTFLFTDIEGSTRLAQEFPDSLSALLIKHNAILRKEIESNNGFVFEIVGDAYCCAFAKAQDAVKAAIDIQIGLANEVWDEAEIKIRIGIHTGSAEWNGIKYMGYITLARTARVMSAAYGEQILISNDVYNLCYDKFIDTREKDITFRDLGERRLKDVIQPIRLFQIVSPGLREDFPKLKTLDARPNNLPIQLTSFIGREKDIKNVRKLLELSRLITLTGTGGSGKTRLAMQAGADMIDEFANGVFITEFADITDPSFLVQTILDSFEILEELEKSPEEVLIEFLKDKTVLLIFDNCEHLIIECAVLSEKLLRNCPELKIIATSREALNCQGEKTYRLPSLTLPDTSLNNSPEQLTQYESVRLFIERALAVNQNFRVNNDNASDLAEICSRLDGIPLAIELAAARVNVLTLEQIHKRLDNRFNLLSKGKRTSLPRQQTLRALIDWSYDLLPEKEKLIWSRLSVFTGGWTLESAEDICSDDKISNEEIFDLLNQLVNKSIIIFDIDKNRYRILESLKQYGREKLLAADEENKFKSSHLEHYMDLSEKCESRLDGNELELWLDILETEHDNLRTSIEWSVKEGNREYGARLSGALSNFWNIRGHYSIGRKMFESVLENHSDISNPILRKLNLWAGILAEEQGDFVKANEYINESLEISRETGDRSGIASGLSELGILAEDQGDFENARKYLEESLKIRRELGNNKEISVSLFNLGNLEIAQRNYKIAENLYEENLELNRQTGNKYQIFLSLVTMGDLAICLKDFIKAKKIYEEAYEVNAGVGDKKGNSMIYSGLGTVARYQGKYDEAKEYYDKSIEVSKLIGDKSGLSVTLCELGELEFKQNNYTVAKKYFEESMVLCRSIESKQGISKALYHLGALSYAIGEPEKSLSFLKDNLKLELEIDIKYSIIESLKKTAVVLNSLNKNPNAVKITGAVEYELTKLENELEILEDDLYEKTKKELQIKLGTKEYDKYFEEGKKLKPEEAYQLIVNS